MADSTAMQFDATPAEIVLLSSHSANHTSRSGYQVLADYLPQATLIDVERYDPVGFFALNCVRVARKLAFSRWYLGGSAVMEWRGLHHLGRKKPALVHYLWTDVDMGFLDLFLRLRHDRIVGTFHHCSDTIANVIRFPRRLREFG